MRYGSTYVCSQAGPCWQAGLLKAVLWKHSDAWEVNRILPIDPPPLLSSTSGLQN